MERSTESVSKDSPERRRWPISPARAQRKRIRVSWSLSICASAGSFDDLAELVDLGPYERIELLRRARLRDCALTLEALAHVREIEYARDFLRKLLEDRLRRLRRREQAIPLIEVEARQCSFSDRRHVGQNR